jgi:hypothetical protein
LEIGQAEQQFEQPSAILAVVRHVAGKQRDGEITLLSKPSEDAGIREFILAAAFLHGGQTSENFVQIVRQAYALATERLRYGSGTGAHTASTNLSGYDHTSSLSSGSSIAVDKQARNQPRLGLCN